MYRDERYVAVSASSRRRPVGIVTDVPYAGSVSTQGDSTPLSADSRAVHVRDPFARKDFLADALRRSMSERLELALSWNKLASELQAGLAKALECEAGDK